MLAAAIFVAGVLIGAASVYFVAVRPLRTSMMALNARMAVVNRRLGSWVVKDLQHEANRTFPEQEIPTKK